MQNFFVPALLFIIDPESTGVAPERAKATFASVKKRAVFCGVVALVIAWLLFACASSPEEGVVTDKPGAGGEPLPFQRPTFNPGQEGMSAGHF